MTDHKLINLSINLIIGTIIYYLIAHTRYGSIFHLNIGLIILIILISSYTLIFKHKPVYEISITMLLTIITNIGITIYTAHQLNNDNNSPYIYVLNQQCQQCANTLKQPLVTNRQAILINGKTHQYQYGNPNLKPIVKQAINQFNNQAGQQQRPIINKTPLLIKLNHRHQIIAVAQGKHLPSTLQDHTAIMDNKIYKFD